MNRGPIYLTSVQARELDRRALADFALPVKVLMENAGRGAAEFLRSLGVSGPVVVGCGKGNNGGDGLVMARWLKEFGLNVWICLHARPDDLSNEAAANWAIVERMRLPCWIQPSLAEWVSLIGRADWLVDAFFGVGLQGPLRPPLDQQCAAANASANHILAVDIPSGLNADTGEPQGPTFRASHTITFAALKQGFKNPASRPFTGKVHVLDLGIPGQLLEEIANS